MPALRQRLGIRSALLATVTLMALVVWDVNRPAGAQWAAASYVAVVRGYQVVGRPVVRRFVVCRFHPSCSDYSLGAVQRHGLVTGLRLTLKRVLSCDGSVLVGTADPVPL